MQIKHFTFNSFQTACYLIWDSCGNCTIIDPGCHSDKELGLIDSFIETNNLKPACIMLTHCHFDHIYGMSELAKRYDIPVYAGRDEMFTLEMTNPYLCKAFGVPAPETYPLISSITETNLNDASRFVVEGDCIDVGELHFEVIETPGHSTGGVCYLERNEKILFRGDTLFAGAIGRSDHPGGDYDQLIKSINEKLMTLESDIRVFPGHGPSTDLATEGMTNPFLLPFNEPYEE